VAIFIIEGEGRDRFGKTLEQGAVSAGQDEKAVAGLPRSAPMIIAVVAKCEESESAGLGTNALGRLCGDGDADGGAGAGFNGIWRTGPLTDSPVVREALNCGEQDKIVGFLYLGTRSLKPPAPSACRTPRPFVSHF
jgi:nitroreductase